jgi:hypothetical protein
MSVRAKFRVNSITRTEADYYDRAKNGDAVTKVPVAHIYLTAVYDANPESENGRFFHASPAGSIQLSTVNKAAADQFEEGKSYYIDFTPAGE